MDVMAVSASMLPMPTGAISRLRSHAASGLQIALPMAAPTAFERMNALEGWGVI